MGLDDHRFIAGLLRHFTNAHQQNSFSDTSKTNKDKTFRRIALTNASYGDPSLFKDNFAPRQFRRRAPSPGRKWVLYCVHKSIFTEFIEFTEKMINSGKVDISPSPPSQVPLSENSIRMFSLRNPRRSPAYTGAKVLFDELAPLGDPLPPA
jgi:hypothetical protein